MSTVHYGDDRLALYIDGVRHIDRVSGQRPINEAVRWGLARGPATDIIRDVARKALPAAEVARAEIPEVPEGILTIINRQLEYLMADL